MASIHSDDLYERLGIAPSASREEIRRAYRSLLRQHPPERAPEEFKRIREAYETLNDAHSRAEYDRAPSASLQRALQLASAAMDASEYGEAEQQLKRALVEDPSLDFARNWLGLCYLYQDKAEQAVAQYDRLLRQPEPAASWYGNAGHAYRMAGSGSVAERMFRRAVALGDAQGDDVSGYYIGLADLYIDQENYGAAESVLEQAIQHDGQVDFEDMQFFAKLLDVQLHRRDLERTRRVLQRIESVAKRTDERFHAALKLGVLARRLIADGAFSFAVPVSQLCLGLQHNDADYQGLSQLARLLKERKVQEAAALTTDHPSFREGGWLASLTPVVREHCSRWGVLADMAPIASAPRLYSVSMVGTRLYGKRDYDSHTESFVATLYFVVLFIPIIPLACYRVIQRGDDRWSFLGKVRFSNKEYSHLTAALVALTILIAASFGKPEASTTGSTWNPDTTAFQPPGIYPPLLGREEQSGTGEEGETPEDEEGSLGKHGSPGAKTIIRFDSLRAETKGDIAEDVPEGVAKPQVEKVDSTAFVYDASNVDVAASISDASRRELERLLEGNYPPLLRDSGVEGRSIMQFVVMEDGRVDPNSIKVITSTHEQFGVASGMVLERARFNPARVGDRKVRMLLQLPITWKLNW